jgi:hypothetical protein
VAVTAAFGLTIPAPHAASFTNGEQAVSVATPINAASGPAAFHLAKWLVLQGGTYVLKAVADDAAVWRVGPGDNTSRRFYDCVVANGVVASQVYLPPGLQRVDILLQNLSAGASACYVAFSLFQDGVLVYASNATGWVFDTAVIADASVPAAVDPRRLMPVFTLLPNWDVGVTEGLAWKTDVLPSETAIEQRRGVRRYARRTIEASFLRQVSQMARLDNFFVGAGQAQVQVPLWFEQYPLPAGLTSGVATLVFPDEALVHREFRDGDLVLVTNKNPDDYDILEIATANVVTDTITWVTAPARSWPAGTRIIPLRTARIMDSAQSASKTDRVGTATVRFDLSEPETQVVPSWGYCAPLWRFKVDRSEDIALTYGRTTFVLDNESGVVDVTDPGERAQVSTRSAVKLFGRAQVSAFRSFIAMARGRALRFYMPTLTYSVEPIGDIAGGDHIDARPMGYVELMRRPQDARLIIGIVFNDGSPPLYRKIVSVLGVGLDTPPNRVTAERLFVDVVLPTILKSRIERIMFIAPSRFAQDAFELLHLVDNSAAVTTAVVTTSVDGTGMPPIDCFVTSKPYPVIEHDELNSSFTLTGGYFVRFFDPEGIDPSFTFPSGSTLRQLLIDYGRYAAEAIDPSFTFPSGSTLRQLLIDYGRYAAEALDPTFALTTGSTLRQMLIDYPNYAPEALDPTFTLSAGGTLV